MAETTHVCEIRFNDISPSTAQLLKSILEFAIVPHCRDFELQFHPVARIAEWRKVDGGDKPGDKQMWFLKKNLGELETLLMTATGNGHREPEIDIAIAVLRTAKELMKTELTKRNVSELIDTLLGAIADVKFVLTKEVPANE